MSPWCFLLLWGLGGLQAMPKASVALWSKPQGATLEIFDASGKKVVTGKTPFVGVLPAGVYRVVLKAPGYFNDQRALRVSAGQQKILRIELLKQSGAPAGRKAAPPTDRRATPPTDRRATPPADRRAAPPTDQRATPPADRRATPATRTAPPVRPTPAPGRGAPVTRKAPSRGAPPVRREPTARRAVTRTPPARPKAPDRRVAAGKKATGAPKKTAKKGRSIPWIPVVAAGALGVAGGIFWAVSGSMLDGSKDRSKFQKDAYLEYQQGRTQRSTATFLLAASGVAVALSVLFYFWKPSSKKARKKRDDHSTVVGRSQPVLLQTQ